MTKVRALALAVASAVLLVAFIVIARDAANETQVLWMLGLASAGFGLIVFAVGDRQRARGLGLRELFALALVGLACRAVLLPSEPVLEDDVYRYLWDGAVLASGQSPYAHSPQTVYDAREGRDLAGVKDNERDDVGALAKLSADTDLEFAFLRINYPSVRTIYPPLAEAQFAALALVAPGNLALMKLSVVVLDAACAIGVLLILASLGAPRAFVLLYWLNPLIVLSFAGSSHMDALPMALLTLAVAFALRARAHVAGALLGLAAAAKLFPLLAWPGLRKQLGVRGTVIAAAITLLAYALLWHPRMFDGLTTFAELWQINGAIHPLLAVVLGSSRARIGAALLVIAVTLAVARRAPLVAITIALTTLVLASPAINPWYVAWLVPFAAVLRSLPLLLLSVTVLSSYSRFALGELPSWLPWIEFGIPLLTALAIHFGRQEIRQTPNI